MSGWCQRPDGEIVHDIDAGTLDATQRELLNAEVERLQFVVGDARFKARFPSPNQKSLLA